MRLPMAALAMIFLAGCNTPDKANIQLRKNNQAQQLQIDELLRQRDADIATIRGLQNGGTTLPSLPPEQIDKLYTVAGIRIGRLTGGDKIADPGPDTMLKVYAAPTDQEGDDIKAAGTFHIELFDQALKSTRIDEWNFDLAQSKAAWHGAGLLYMYVLDCPWKVAPIHEKLVVRVTFTDALTHRILTSQEQITIKLPPS